MVQRQTEGGGMMYQTGRLHSTGEGGEKLFHMCARFPQAGDATLQMEMRRQSKKREARALKFVFEGTLRMTKGSQTGYKPDSTTDILI